jgi:DNA-binding PadR family transcriptional regulator
MYYSILPKKYRGEELMKYLSRQEELMLLVILKLRGGAYGVPIREDISKLTEKYWSIGAVYDILDRLTRKGFASVTVSEPVKVRGGKSRRYYGITKRGYQALEEVRLLQDRARSAFREAGFEER